MSVVTAPAEPADRREHWPVYAQINFGFTAAAVAGAAVGFALMHVGFPNAETYAICCTVAAVVVYAATVVSLKQDQILRREATLQSSVDAAMGYLRSLSRSADRMEEGQQQTAATATAILGEEMETGERLDELTTNFMAHREGTKAAITASATTWRDIGESIAENGAAARDLPGEVRRAVAEELRPLCRAVRDLADDLDALGQPGVADLEPLRHLHIIRQRLHDLES